MHYSRFFNVLGQARYDFDEMIAWAEEFIGPHNARWWYQSNVAFKEKPDDWLLTHGTVFTFEYEEDAVAFELRWRQ